jgi:hypothetical protein
MCGVSAVTLSERDAPRGGLTGRDPAAELAHVPFVIEQGGGAPGAGGASNLIRVATLCLASSVTIVSRPEFLRRLFNSGEVHARDRVSR